MSRIQLYSQSDIDQIDWPQSEESTQAQQLPLLLLQEGVDRLITNVKTDYYFLKIDAYILPITVNHTEYQNAYLTSNYYAVKQLREKANRLLKPWIGLYALIMKGIKVNQSVIVNNWLLSNSLYPDLSIEQLELITTFLQEKFPHHLIMMRSINVADGKTLLQKLKQIHYHTFFSRQIFYFDPKTKPGKKAAYHRRRDERLMENEGYTLGKSTNYEGLIELFNRIYKDKHTIYCPHYTPLYLKYAVESKFLTVKVLQKEGKDVGVFGYTIRNGVMIVPFFGYDPASPTHRDVYRLLTMLVIKEAKTLNVALNDGSGGDQTKIFRGMQPVDEYAAIYTKHLPLGRKLFWKMADRFSKSF